MSDTKINLGGFRVYRDLGHDFRIAPLVKANLARWMYRRYHVSNHHERRKLSYYEPA